MKGANSAMIALLNSAGPANPLLKANLVGISLKDGTTLFLTDFDKDVSDGAGKIYSSSGPLLRLSELTWRVGTQVEELKLELWSLLTDLIGSAIVLESIANRSWTDALIQVQRTYWAPPIAASLKTVPVGPQGTIKIFQGNVADVPVFDEVHAEINFKSRKGLLTIQWPYNTFQPSCPWVVYGAACGASQDAFTKVGTVAAGSISLLLNTSLTDPDHYYDEGTITFTSGQNSGQRRTVRSYLAASGQILFFIPFPFPPATGDTFAASKGCAHTMAACQQFFGANFTLHFGGEPFIPVAESSV